MHYRLYSALILAVCVTGTSFAHAPFASALKARFELKSASCYTCHVKGKDEAGKTLGKEHRNEFGQVLHEALKDKKLTAYLAAEKEKGTDEYAAAKEKAAAEFNKIIGDVEAKASKSGKTWKELITAGELEGVKLPE